MTCDTEKLFGLENWPILFKVSMTYETKRDSVSLQDTEERKWWPQKTQEPLPHTVTTNRTGEIEGNYWIQGSSCCFPDP